MDANKFCHHCKDVNVKKLFYSLSDLPLIYDRTDIDEVQCVLYKSRRLGKITDFHVVEVIRMDVIILCVHAVMTVYSFHYGRCTKLILWILYVYTPVCFVCPMFIPYYVVYE